MKKNNFLLKSRFILVCFLMTFTFISFESRSQFTMQPGYVNNFGTIQNIDNNNVNFSIVFSYPNPLQAGCTYFFATIPQQFRPSTDRYVVYEDWGYRIITITSTGELRLFVNYVNPQIPPMFPVTLSNVIYSK